MTERATALANRVREACAALVQTVGQIDDAHWGQVVEEGVWSPGKDAEHVTQGAVFHQWIVRRAAMGDTSDRPVGAPRDVMVAVLSKAEVLDLLQQRADQSARLVESLSETQLDLPAPPMGEGPPRTVAEMIEGQMILHYHEHRENIEAKLRT